MLISIEKLVHFQCEICTKWWTIGDAPIDTKVDWYCPWCGQKQNIEVCFQEFHIDII